MAKSQLKAPLDALEGEIIETLIAGHKQWRPDLSYPESHSDMQAAVRGLLRMFKVERRPIAVELEYHDDSAAHLARSFKSIWRKQVAEHNCTLSFEDWVAQESWRHMSDEPVKG